MTNPESLWEDPVDVAFSRLRQQAKQTTGYIPDLQKPAMNTGGLQQRMQQSTPKKRGKPTGRDGYPLPHRKAPKRIDTVMKQSAQQNAWVKRLAVARLLSDWEALVGAQIAQQTVGLRYDEGTLYVECTSTPWASTLRSMQSQVLKKLAAELGDEVVLALKVYGPKPPNWRHGKFHVSGRGPRDTYG